MTKKLNSHYGLKWNPFSPEAPTRSFLVSSAIEHFSWRIEHLASEGGFALLTGDPGTGKSVALRILLDRLTAVRDLEVRVLTRPQSSLADFYRELGELFGVELQPHNRWRGAKALRQQWKTFITSALIHPVLIVDEAQEMVPTLLNELRFLASAELDAHCLLTIVLAGDGRLPDKFRSRELIPLGTRIRVRATLEPRKPPELREHLDHVLEEAGAPALMTEELAATLCEHAAGNLRALMNMAGELLDAGLEQDGRALDEQLYLEVFAGAAPAKPTPKRRGGRKVG
jgi:type II secretory pathway predicted ATPase ExeA